MIKRNAKILLSALLLLGGGTMSTLAKQWTLGDCVNYALANNISLRKTVVTYQSAQETLLQSKAALLPSLSASTSQNVTYNPWPERGSYMIAGDKVQTNVDKTYYNGSYGINASWTVWNGNRNHNQVKLDQLSVDEARLDSATTANSIQEQIAQLFVQILYSKDAVAVNKATLEASKANEARGKEFVKVGSMSKADLAQLTAQRAQDEYAVVQAESSLREYKRQLKQLLQITSEEEFDVTVPTTTDAMALAAVPSVSSVYESALANRPEIQRAATAIKASDLQLKIAKAGKMPTVSLSAGLNSNTTSMSNNGWGTQLKNNFAFGGGVTLSVPLFDNRQTKTAVNRAILERQSNELDLRDKQTTLYSTIENYWLQAVNNQAQYRSAKVSTESAQTSYNLLQEQFKQNLKNVIELMNGKNALLKAQQAELQAKYLAILNQDMLKFYQNGTLKQ